ncbi:mitochondrial potassium channel-like [Diachasmimorpha longicaudata]|uniref:mitochondrial potassium channel-like n=1 Tax=Diachasmimorpha longicaudata TaxID=58733 RepID=UPI0030B907CB
MSGQSRKLFEALTSRINRSPLLTSVVEGAAEKAHHLQNKATEKYDTLVKHVHGNTTTIIQDFHKAALQPSPPIPVRLVSWWRWYQQLTGLEDVELAKRQVIAVQDKLFHCQDQRRDLMHQARTIAEKLKDIYGELVQTKREDPKYVQLTIMENKGLQDQNRIMGQLRLLENEERDHFTQLATAIKEYQDSQSINAQKYKYLSILASAGIAVLSLGGSMIYNNRRIADVRNVIATGQIKNETLFREYFDSFERTVNKQQGFFSSWRNETTASKPTPVVISSPPQRTSKIVDDKVIIVGALLFVCYVLGRITS